jgi:hypothetical protein
VGGAVLGSLNICGPYNFETLHSSGSQTFLGHCPLDSINSSPVSPALPYKKHSSEQQFAQPTKEDNNNKIKILHLVTTSVSKFLM